MSIVVAPHSVYGPLVAACDVEDAIRDVLQVWIESYLYEVERQHQMPVGELPVPRSWVTSAELTRFPEDQTTSVIITSPGTLETPAADGRGLYRARWRVDVATQVVAGGNRIAPRLARLYTLAMRAIVVQHQDHGLARRIDWMGERYDLHTSVDERTLAVGVCSLRVETFDVTDRNTAPSDLETEASPDSPTHPIAQTREGLIVKWPPQDPFPPGDQYPEE